MASDIYRGRLKSVFHRTFGQNAATLSPRMDENLLKEIEMAKARVDAVRPLSVEQQSRLDKKVRLEWNYNSNALEGNNVSLGETMTFLEHGLTAKGKPFKDYLDIRGHDDAILALKDIVHRRIPLSESTIRELHKVLLQEPYSVGTVNPDGSTGEKRVALGEYKSQANRTLTAVGEIHHFASPTDTPILMAELVSRTNEALENPDRVIEVACEFHHRFTAIHPFDDGNGRMARLLSNLILMREGFPPLVVLKEDRNQYLAALSSADAGDYSAIQDYFGSRLLASLALVEKAAKGDPLDEIRDISRGLHLLEQRVQHIDDPIVYSEENCLEIYTRMIDPFFSSALNELQRFIPFFLECGATITANLAKPGQSRSWDGGQTRTPDDARGALVSLFTNHSEKFTPSSFEIRMSLSKFKKTPFNRLNIDVRIGAVLERNVLQILREGAIFEQYVYADTPTLEDAVRFTTAVCEPQIKAMHQHLDEVLAGKAPD